MTYNPRNWIVRELDFKEVDGLPTVEAPISEDRVVSMLSAHAERFERDGVTDVFYYDLEQEVAGLDKIYGTSGIKSAAEDFELSDGTSIKAGALIFPVTRIDFEARTVAVLFEEL